MTDAIAPKLHALRDIEGVLGSFVIGERGEVLARDVTAACGSDVLALAGGRLSQLCGAFVSADIGGPFDSTTLHFAQYKLHIRASGSMFLVAVVAAEVNLPALKMAMNMLGRQLVHELATVDLPAEPDTAAELSPPAQRTSQPPPRSSQPPPRSSQPPPASERLSQPPDRPSHVSPRPDGRESAVPTRSYRGTRIAH